MNPTNPPATLRIRYTGGTYIATNMANSKESVSCTMGEASAALRWVERYAPGVRIADVRACVILELDRIDRSKDKPGVYYYTWDVANTPEPTTEPTEEVTETPAEETAPAEPVSNVLHLPALSLAMHPLLDRVMLVPDAVGTLRETSRDKDNRGNADDLDSDWQAWLDEIRENGILEPLRVVLEGDRHVVIEGRHRLRAAQELGFETVPCILVEIDDLLKYAEGTVRGRRHWTKSQRAWFAVLMHPEIAAEDRKTGRPEKPRTEYGVFSNEDLATRYGISLGLTEVGIWVFRTLEKYSHLRVKYESRLWGGQGLPGLKQGLIAETNTAAPTGPGVTIERHPVSKLSKIWTSERAHTANWAKADDKVRAVLAADLRSEAVQLPADYLDWKLEILEAAIAEIRTNQKGATA